MHYTQTRRYGRCRTANHHATGTPQPVSRDAALATLRAALAVVEQFGLPTAAIYRQKIAELEAQQLPSTQP